METASPKNVLLKEIQKRKSEKNYDAMLAAAQKAVHVFPTEERFIDALHYAQAHYVKEKLDSQILRQLEEKKDYKALAMVYQKLLTIFPESGSLKGLLKKVHKKIQKGHEQELQAYYQSASEQIEKMIEEGELENAVEASYEILDQNPGDKRFIKLLVKAEEALDRQMNKELQVFFKDQVPALKAEYKLNQDQFIEL